MGCGTPVSNDSSVRTRSFSNMALHNYSRQGAPAGKPVACRACPHTEVLDDQSISPFGREQVQFNGERLGRALFESQDQKCSQLHEESILKTVTVVEIVTTSPIGRIYPCTCANVRSVLNFLGTHIRNLVANDVKYHHILHCQNAPWGSSFTNVRLMVLPFIGDICLEIISYLGAADVAPLFSNVRRGCVLATSGRQNLDCFLTTPMLIGAGDDSISTLECCCAPRALENTQCNANIVRSFKRKECQRVLSRDEVLIQLQRGCVEVNPGPTYCEIASGTAKQRSLDDIDFTPILCDKLLPAIFDGHIDYRLQSIADVKNEMILIHEFEREQMLAAFMAHPCVRFFEAEASKNLSIDRLCRKQVDGRIRVSFDEMHKRREIRQLFELQNEHLKQMARIMIHEHRARKSMYGLADLSRCSPMQMKICKRNVVRREWHETLAATKACFNAKVEPPVHAPKKPKKCSYDMFVSKHNQVGAKGKQKPNQKKSKPLVEGPVELFFDCIKWKDLKSAVVKLKGGKAFVTHKSKTYQIDVGIMEEDEDLREYKTHVAHVVHMHLHKDCCGSDDSAEDEEKSSARASTLESMEKEAAIQEPEKVIGRVESRDGSGYCHQLISETFKQPPLDKKFASTFEVFQMWLKNEGITGDVEIPKMHVGVCFEMLNNCHFLLPRQDVKQSNDHGLPIPCAFVELVANQKSVHHCQMRYIETDKDATEFVNKYKRTNRFIGYDNGESEIGGDVADYTYRPVNPIKAGFWSLANGIYKRIPENDITWEIRANWKRTLLTYRPTRRFIEPFLQEFDASVNEKMDRHGLLNKLWNSTVDGPRLHHTVQTIDGTMQIPYKPTPKQLYNHFAPDLSVAHSLKQRFLRELSGRTHYGRLHFEHVFKPALRESVIEMSDRTLTVEMAIRSMALKTQQRAIELCGSTQRHAIDIFQTMRHPNYTPIITLSQQFLNSFQQKCQSTISIVSQLPRALIGMVLRMFGRFLKKHWLAVGFFTSLSLALVATAVLVYLFKHARLQREVIPHLLPRHNHMHTRAGENHMVEDLSTQRIGNSVTRWRLVREVVLRHLRKQTDRARIPADSAQAHLPGHFVHFSNCRHVFAHAPSLWRPCCPGRISVKEMTETTSATDWQEAWQLFPCNCWNALMDIWLDPTKVPCVVLTRGKHVRRGQLTTFGFPATEMVELKGEFMIGASPEFTSLISAIATQNGPIPVGQNARFGEVGFMSAERKITQAFSSSSLVIAPANLSQQLHDANVAIGIPSVEYRHWIAATFEDAHYLNYAQQIDGTFSSWYGPRYTLPEVRMTVAHTNDLPTQTTIGAHGDCGHTGKGSTCEYCNPSDHCPKCMNPLNTVIVPGRHGVRRKREVFCGICDEWSSGLRAWKTMANKGYSHRLPTGIHYPRPFSLATRDAIKVGTLDPAITFQEFDHNLAFNKVQRGPSLYGMAQDGVTPTVVTTDPTNLKASSFSRQFSVNPPTIPNVVRDYRASADEFVKELIMNFKLVGCSTTVKPYDLVGYLMRFPPSKRRSMANSLVHLGHSPKAVEEICKKVNVPFVLQEVKKAHDEKTNPKQRSIFLKHEMLTKNTAPYDPHSVSGRIITGATHHSPIMNLGPYVLAFQQALKKVWNIDQRHEMFGIPVIFASGLTMKGLGAVFTAVLREFLFVVGADYGRFDKTNRQHHHEMEKAVYKAFGFSKAAMKAFSDQADNEAVLKIGRVAIFRAKWNFRRNSGDCNTTCGNSLVNASMLCWGLKRICRRRGWSLKDFIVCVGGDDVMIGSNHDPKLWMPELIADIAAVGCVLEPQYPLTKECIRFMGCVPYPTSDGYMPGPCFERFFGKSGWCIKEVNNFMAWNREVSQAWLASFSHCPIVYHVMRSTYRLSKDARGEVNLPLDGILYRAQFDKYTSQAPTIEAYRTTIDQLADIGVNTNFVEMLSLYAMLDDVQSLPALVSHPVLDRLGALAY